MNCLHCSRETNPEYAYCPHCGRSALAPLQPAKKSMSGRVLKGIIAALLAVVVCAIFIVLFSQDMTDSVVEQLGLIRNDRITEAYYTYSSKSFQQATSLEQFQDFLASNPAIAQGSSIRFIDRNVEGEHGVLRGLLTISQGHEIPLTYHMIKEGDRWKVLTIIFDKLPDQSLHGDLQSHQSMQKQALSGDLQQKP